MRPSPVNAPHSTGHRTCTDSYMHVDRVPPWTMKQSTFISWWDHRSSMSYSAIGIGFYKLLSVFANSYTPHMTQFYMPTFGNHRNNSKTAPISLYLVRYPLGNPWLRSRCACLLASGGIIWLLLVYKDPDGIKIDSVGTNIWKCPVVKPPTVYPHILMWMGQKGG